MKNVLITGTTSGIGKAFAEKFAGSGDALILVSRNEEKLKRQQEELKARYHTTVNYIACDLTQKGAAKAVIKKLSEWGVCIDILINNAGFNECGMFISTSMDKEIEMINLHISFVTELTKYVLQNMLSKNYGRILNVGSTGSFVASPSDAVYSATKAYVISFSNALCGELVHTGVKVTTLCPGAVHTEFAEKAGLHKSLLFQIAVMQPKKVVDIAYSGILKGKRVIIPGIYNKSLVLFSKILPLSLLNKITLMMMK